MGLGQEEETSYAFAQGKWFQMRNTESPLFVTTKAPLAECIPSGLAPYTNTTIHTPCPPYLSKRTHQLFGLQSSILFSKQTWPCTIITLKTDTRRDETTYKDICYLSRAMK